MMVVVNQFLPVLAALSLVSSPAPCSPRTSCWCPTGGPLPADTFYALHPTFGPLL